MTNAKKLSIVSFKNEDYCQNVLDYISGKYKQSEDEIAEVLYDLMKNTKSDLETIFEFINDGTSIIAMDNFYEIGELIIKLSSRGVKASDAGEELSKVINKLSTGNKWPEFVKDSKFVLPGFSDVYDKEIEDK